MAKQEELIKVVCNKTGTIRHLAPILGNDDDFLASMDYSRVIETPLVKMEPIAKAEAPATEEEPISENRAEDIVSNLESETPATEKKAGRKPNKK